MTEPTDLQTEDMPPDLADIFNALDDLVKDLHLRWALFTQLFAVSEERVVLLNEGAPLVAWLLQEFLWDDAVLRISKLADPAATGRKTNLSLYRIVEDIRTAGEIELAEPLNADLEVLCDHCVTLREHRNKRIAHNDLAATLQPAQVLDLITRKMVEDSLSTVRTFMNRINRHFGRSHVLYETIAPPSSADGEHFARILVEGLRYLQLVRGRKIDRADILQSEHTGAIKPPATPYIGPTGPIGPPDFMG